MKPPDDNERAQASGNHEMKPEGNRRHVMDERDCCVVCGVRLERTDSLHCTWPDGRVTMSAGACPGPAVSDQRKGNDHE
jgi:hypothetical protein